MEALTIRLVLSTFTEYNAVLLKSSYDISYVALNVSHNAEVKLKFLNIYSYISAADK